jgi:[acyl-carrier-protein] S-malonyltransferase
MSKIAFIFPGQGSQYVGMTKDLYENSAFAPEVFEKAEKILGFDIKKICFEGPENELKQTRITQPAIFLHSVILTGLFTKVKPDMLAGHSLGEYAAVALSGALSYKKALELVALRGKLMQEAGEKNKGTMAAIIGLDSVKINDICLKASEAGIVQPANFNSADQLVISGSIDGVRKAMELAKETGAKLVKELVVSGAFHSPLMQSAADGLTEALNNTEFAEPRIPVYANVDAEPEKDPDKMRQNLIKQVTSAVRWTDTIKNMEKDGAEIFIEIGPGKVLQGLVKKLCPSKKVFGIDKFADINNIEQQILN